MDPMQIFWLFFMLAALQPAITQRLLEASRKRLIGRIERERALALGLRAVDTAGVGGWDADTGRLVPERWHALSARSRYGWVRHGRSDGIPHPPL